MTQEAPRRAIAILAGGHSRRMGSDKALLLTVEGPLLERTLRCAAEADANAALLVCGRPQPGRWSGPAAHFLLDAQADGGPLVGVLTALTWAAEHHRDQVLVLPCDLPRLTSAAITWLLALPCAAHGAVTSHDEALQPLAAIYTVAAIPRLRAELTHRRSLLAIVREADFLAHPVPAWANGCIADADTPADWQRFAQP